MGVQQLLPTSLGHIVSKTYDTTLSQNVLQLLKTTPPTKALATHTLDKQLDGVFCTDGILRYDAGSKRLLYVYYYRNKFVLLDEKLNTQLVGKTIDTTDHVNFSVGSITEDNRVTSSFSTPPRLVNRNAFFNGQWIFVHSALISDNENISDFRKTSVIDIYQVSNGKYLYSVKVPDLKGSKIRDFIVSGNRLLLLYDSALHSYKIRLPK